MKSTNFPPNLSLGQHFIKNTKFLEIMSEGLDKNITVIEIGAGMGNLTEFLVKKAKKVITFEVDKRFQNLLYALVSRHKNLEIVFDSALSDELDKVILKEKRKSRRIKIVSNLPYHITEPFLNKIITFSGIAMRLMVGEKFGIQAQITDPEDPNFSELSLLCLAFFDVKKIADVPKDAFSPAPRTDSVILEFIPKKLNLSDSGSYIARNLFISQKKGSLIKNFLMNAYVHLSKLTKNEARKKVAKLNLPAEILSKSFSQLNGEEVRTLAQALKVNGKHD